MKLLLVEDRPEYARTVREELAGDIEVSVARSRDSALSTLRAETFDLIVCDLDIPPTDDHLDSDVAHGDVVRAEIEESYSGTPVIVHSAFGTIRYLAERIDAARTEDVFGDRNQMPMISFIEKDHTPDLIDRIHAVREHLVHLADIELHPEADDLTLRPEDQRILRIYSRRVGGRFVRVWGLSGGLSDARVFRVLVVRGEGGIAASVVARIDTLRKIRAESAVYDQHVSPLLGVRGIAAKAGEVCAGAATMGGIFYRVAEAYRRSFLDVLRDEPDRGGDLVWRIQAITERWVDGAPTRTLPVSEIRRHIVPDEKMPSPRDLEGLEWEAFEDRQVQVRLCDQHRDLHVLNVLVDNEHQPILIDYAEVGPASGTLDPVTLELCLAFHPACQGAFGGWPTHEQLGQWSDLERYLYGCPVEGFIRECRRWAEDVGPGQRAILATAYSYGIRQLRYGTVAPDRAKTLLTGLVSAWR